MTAPVLASRFERRSDVAPIVRAALAVEIVYVPLAAIPRAGEQVLQLWVKDELVAALSAEPVGSGRDGEYPLRVRPLDAAHVPELHRLATADRHQSFRAGAAAPVEEAPVSEAQVEDRTLASRGGAAPSKVPPQTRAAPAVQMIGLETPINPTTVFDPESLLRARERRAPSGSESEQEDNTLTIPRASSPHPGAVRDRDMLVDEDTGTLPTSGARREQLVSWNIRLAPTTKDPLCGRTISAGKYTLDSLIGNGAIGIVFKASHRDLGRTVAIKVLNPRYRDDPDLLGVFRTEARAASQLEHANVARVYDYGQEPDGLVYIVMEYLSGYTLGNVLGARKRLAVSRAIEIMMQTCAGLSAAHDRGIVHRDVKPDNIVLVPAQDDEGRPVENVKVCDFGIAALGTAKAHEDHVAGSPEYMAPEQGLGEAVTPAADVYACGVVLYEMLTGEVPFTGKQPYQILLKHQREVPVPPSSRDPSIPRELDAVVMRALEKKPALRFQSARELRSELRRIAEKPG